LTDADYEDFITYAKSRQFTYNTRTEQLYKELKEVAKEESYYADAESEFAALFGKIEPHKEQDLVRFKDQIKEELENEIVSRYYYQNGRAKNAVRYDPCLQRINDVFGQQYSKLLMPR
jgi:carboxyl-terminal processing protease